MTVAKMTVANDEMVDNLYAEYQCNPDNQPENHLCHLAFCGHVDVVPAGDEALWQSPPFSPQQREGRLFGRGSVDMKSAVASWIIALARFISENKLQQKPIILSIIITGDEEDKAINGVAKIVTWLQQQGKKIDFCITGEPTSSKQVGDAMKIGRRGSFNAKLTLHGLQGHVAYPEQCANAAHGMNEILHHLLNHEWDKGDEFFPASHLQITSIDIDNSVSNISPGKATARFNIRYNHQHQGASLEKTIRAMIEKTAPILYDKTKPMKQPEYRYQLSTAFSESFYCAPTKHHDNIINATQLISNITPKFSTEGGISDSRFLANFCPVVDFGLCNKQMHQIDESVPIDDIETLCNIYHAIITGFAD